MRSILNLGCGNDSYGDVRVDITRTPTTTHVFDLNEKFLLPSNSFDEIKAEQVLEHLKNLGIFADECYRVLKKGGRIRLRTDHAGFIFYYLFDRWEHNKILERWYKGNTFGHEQNSDKHYYLFVESHLKNLFHSFKNPTVKYFYKNPHLLIKTFLMLLPFKLGASQIELEAWK